MEASRGVLEASWAVWTQSRASGSERSAIWGSLGSPKRPQEPPRSSQGSPPEPPGSSQEPPRAPGEPPRAPRSPQEPPRAPGSRWETGVPAPKKPSAPLDLRTAGLHEPWGTPLRAEGTVADSREVLSPRRCKPASPTTATLPLDTSSTFTQDWRRSCSLPRTTFQLN